MGCGAAASPWPAGATAEISTRRRESGAQSKSDTPLASRVTRSARPPRQSSSQSCSTPAASPRADRKANRSPSGLQRGARSGSGVEVSCRVSEPSQRVAHRSLVPASVAASTPPTLYATHCPSGEIRGSDTCWRASRSAGSSALPGSAAPTRVGNAEASDAAVHSSASLSPSMACVLRSGGVGSGGRAPRSRRRLPRASAGPGVARASFDRKGR